MKLSWASHISIITIRPLRGMVMAIRMVTDMHTVTGIITMVRPLLATWARHSQLR